MKRNVKNRVKNGVNESVKNGVGRRDMLLVNSWRDMAKSQKNRHTVVMRRLALALGMTALAGCSDLGGTTLAEDLGISGSYDLATINDVALPTTSGGVVVDSGFFEVRADDEIYFQDYYHVPGTSGPSQIRSGSYTLQQAESGTTYGQTISAMPGFESPVFGTAHPSVTVTGYTGPPSGSTFSTRVYNPR